MKPIQTWKWQTLLPMHKFKGDDEQGHAVFIDPAGKLVTFTYDELLALQESPQTINT